MPALREVQRAFARALWADDAAAVQCELELDGTGLEIYRNNCVGTLTSALVLSFPAVRRLVGAACFEAAAQQFIRTRPPTSAYLNLYGEAFAEFLAHYSPASRLRYLADVARLEWAVNRALHASDAPALELAALAALEATRMSSLSFIAHPSVSLLQLESAADAIWRAVLDADERAMAAIDPHAGPVRLLIERSAAGVQVRRMSPGAWRFTERLCAGMRLQAALEDPDAATQSSEELNAVLADHLASGRFTAWRSE